MKMALQYWQAKGQPRRRFLPFRNGYHGDTFGAMSVCDPKNSMHSLWQGYLPKGWSWEEYQQKAESDPQGTILAAKRSMADHVQAMLAFHETVSYTHLPTFCRANSSCPCHSGILSGVNAWIYL